MPAISGGLARAAVFGMSDGLMSNVLLVLGFAGSGVNASVVRLAGIAGALAGAVSMAAGEWISISAQNELVIRELDVERRELVVNKEAEQRTETVRDSVRRTDVDVERINDPDLEIDERTILVIRGAGPLGWPGSAEVVNMQPPDALLQRGITSLPTLGDGRQSGTSDSPSILNASPESAAGGGLSWLRTGDIIRIDLENGRCDALVDEAEIAVRKAAPPPPVPDSQTPWEELYREKTGQLADGGVGRPSPKPLG